MDNSLETKARGRPRKAGSNETKAVRPKGRPKVFESHDARIKAHNDKLRYTNYLLKFKNLYEDLNNCDIENIKTEYQLFLKHILSHMS